MCNITAQPQAQPPLATLELYYLYVCDGCNDLLFKQTEAEKEETHLLEAPGTAGVHSQTLLACAGSSGGAHVGTWNQHLVTSTEMIHFTLYADQWLPPQLITQGNHKYHYCNKSFFVCFLYVLFFTWCLLVRPSGIKLLKEEDLLESRHYERRKKEDFFFYSNETGIQQKQKRTYNKLPSFEWR